MNYHTGQNGIITALRISKKTRCAHCSQRLLHSKVLLLGVGSKASPSLPCFPEFSRKLTWSFPEASLNLPWSFPEASLILPWTFLHSSWCSIFLTLSLYLPWTFPEASLILRWSYPYILHSSTFFTSFFGLVLSSYPSLIFCIVVLFSHLSLTFLDLPLTFPQPFCIIVVGW